MTRIWFVEKDQQGASHLYSLAEFKVRNDKDYERGYIQGRYGAVPYLSHIQTIVSGNMPKKHKPSGRGYQSQQVNTREPLPRFLIVCEGEKTEPAYFDGFRVPSVTILRLPVYGTNPFHVS